MLCIIKRAKGKRKNNPPSAVFGAARAMGKTQQAGPLDENGNEAQCQSNHQTKLFTLGSVSVKRCHGFFDQRTEIGKRGGGGHKIGEGEGRCQFKNNRQAGLQISRVEMPDENNRNERPKRAKQL